MADEPRVERIMLWLEARLLERQSDAGVHYPPDVVLPVDEPTFEHFAKAGDQGAEVLYLLFLGDDETPLSRSTGSITETVEIGIVAARRANVERKTDDPFTGQKPRPRTVRERLAKDVLDKLCGGDLSMGGLCTELLAPEHVNRQYYVEGWDCVHIPFTVVYHHLRGSR